LASCLLIFFVAYKKISLNRASQEQVIKKYSGQLEKLGRKIPGCFEVEDIHHWRVDYKKLRAFLRMSTSGRKEPKPLISVDLKTLYKIAGTIRDIQLFIPAFQMAFPDYFSDTPVYYSLLQRKLFIEKEDYIKVYEKISFPSEEETWCNWLPDYLTTERIKKFVQENITAIRLLLIVPITDKNLHSIRKHLKDIIYNIHTCSSFWGIPFPVAAWRNEKGMNDMALELGNYMDTCNKLLFFEPTYTNLLPLEERKILKNIQQDWMNEKDKQVKLVTERINQLQLFQEVKKI
jgi:hypothetical protein